MVEHLIMISIDMQFMLDKEKLPFLTWHPSGLTPWQIQWSLNVCVCWQINMKHLRENIQFLCFQFRKVEQRSINTVRWKNVAFFDSWLLR